MREIFFAMSTSGRWGLAVVGPEGATLPAQGSLRHLGVVEGISTFEFEPGNTGTWVLAVNGEVTVHGGGTVVASDGLQSSRHACILLVGKEAVIERHGYKGRGSSVRAYVEGVEKNIPPTVLLAMGLVESGGEIVAVPPPPPLVGAMAAAFAAAFSK